MEPEEDPLDDLGAEANGLVGDREGSAAAGGAAASGREEGPRSEATSSQPLSRPSALHQSLRERGGRPTVRREDDELWIVERPPLAPEGPQGATASEATLNLLNCLLGNSLMALPWAFRETGLLLGAVLLIVGSVLNRYTLLLLLRLSDATGGTTYPEVGRLALNRSGEAAVVCSYLLYSGGALCAYSVGLADLLGQQAQVFGLARPQRFTAAAAAALLCAPGMLQGSLKQVAVFSALCFVGAICFCGVLASLALDPTEPNASFEDLYWVRPGGLVAAWPIFGYVFAAQPGGIMVLGRLMRHKPTNAGGQPLRGGQGAGVEGARDDLERSHQRRYNNDIDDDDDDTEEFADPLAEHRRVSEQVYIIATTLGLLMGLCSYVRFGPATRGNILESCHQERHSLWPGAMVWLRLSSTAMLLCSAAFMVVPCRFALLEVMRISNMREAEEEVPSHIQRGITMALLVLMFLVGGLCDDISSVYRFVGAIATQLLAFVLPGCFALRLVARRRENYEAGEGPMELLKRLGPLFVTLFGLTMLFACLGEMLGEALQVWAS